MTNEMGPEIKGIKEHDEEVEMRDGEKITCRIYQPENSSSPGPLFVSHRHERNTGLLFNPIDQH